MELFNINNVTKITKLNHIFFTCKNYFNNNNNNNNLYLVISLEVNYFLALQLSVTKQRSIIR